MPGSAAQFDTFFEVLLLGHRIAYVLKFFVQPRGITALLDATGTFITEFGEQLSALPDARPVRKRRFPVEQHSRMLDAGNAMLNVK